MTTAAPAVQPKSQKKTRTQTVEVAERGCWFEYNANLPEEVKRGYPERIFTADDPRWAEFEKTKSMQRGSFCVGAYERAGDHFLPDTVKAEHALQTGWAKAWEKMTKFESEGRAWDTPRHDALRDEEEKVKRANEAQALLIANAIASGITAASKKDAK